MSVRNSRSFARTGINSSEALMLTWGCCISLVRSTCQTSGAFTWRNRLRRRCRGLADFVQILLQRPTPPTGCSDFVFFFFPGDSGEVCRHSGGTFIYLLRVACTGSPLAFRVFQCVHGDSCGDDACFFLVRRVVHPDSCRQRSDQPLPRPCAYTMRAGSHVLRPRPLGPSHDRRRRQVSPPGRYNGDYLGRLHGRSSK